MSRPGDQPNKERGLAELKELIEVGRDVTIEMIDRGEPVGWVSPAGVISVGHRRPYLCQVGTSREWSLDPPDVRYQVQQIVRRAPGAPVVAAAKVFLTRPKLLAEIASAVAFLPPDEVGGFPFDEESEYTDVFSLLLCEDPILFQHEQRHVELGQVAVRWLVFPKVMLRGADERGPSKMVIATHSFERDFMPRRLVIPSSVPPDVTISMRVGLNMVEDNGTPVSMFSERALGMAKTYPVLRAGVSITVEVCNPTPGWVEFTSVIVGIEPVVAGVPSAAEAAAPSPAEVVAERWPQGAPPEPSAATEGPPAWNEPVAELERRLRAVALRSGMLADPTIPEMVEMGQIVPTSGREEDD